MLGSGCAVALHLEPFRRTRRSLLFDAFAFVLVTRGRGSQIMNPGRLSAVALRAPAWRYAAATAFCMASNVGCDEFSAPVKSPADEAAEVVRTRCASNADETPIVPLLDGTAIESVEPLYNNGLGGARIGHWSLLVGTVITVRPLPSVTAEWLTRELECHSARRVAGSTPASTLPNDPFWLPGKMVDIDAQSAHGSFRVEVRAAHPAEAQELLDRARAFTRMGSPRASL
jgi:hypothetical protein